MSLSPPSPAPSPAGAPSCGAGAAPWTSACLGVAGQPGGERPLRYALQERHSKGDLQGARVWLGVMMSHVLKLPGGDKVRSDGEHGALSLHCSEGKAQAAADKHGEERCQYCVQCPQLFLAGLQDNCSCSRRDCGLLGLTVREKWDCRSGFEIGVDKEELVS
ncbi:hypothetical protein GW7_20015 [Heterocephalus glaber]|uniref:Uncharacterized protein n=1 Tax=Heterocephalus glaber TaxID=10181 RepID=G5BP93_HETGA|nr:hypothetical protein GW7_20015 [Heterocephalus glaber]